MISAQSHTSAWINQVRSNSLKTDPILIEKMIMAFTLLESLKLQGLDFIFKGGTSLALVLKKLQRFSIDIDIVISHEQDLQMIFSKIASNGIFTWYEEDIRKGGVPKAHFKFYFQSVVQRKESYVLLDVLFESNPYPVIHEFVIDSPILSLEGERTTVLCPTVDCLMADKLTAFCPHTTGIRYHQEKELEIAKQLFDLGSLFDAAADVNLIRSTHHQIASQELLYRQFTHLAPKDVLLDTFQTACFLGTYGNNGDREEYQELSKGISKLHGFVFGGTFSKDDAVLCAAKVAYLSALILNESPEITHFDDGLDLSRWTIPTPHFLKLNRLKMINPEAFYYFYLAQDVFNAGK
jgi:hypothetical protein